MNQMTGAGHPMPLRQALQLFIDGLPMDHYAYQAIQFSVQTHINTLTDAQLPPLAAIFEDVVMAENNIASRAARVPRVRSSRTHPASSSATRPLVPATSSASSASAVPAAPSARLTCSNCKRTGHAASDCFQPGGAMEGRRDEVITRRALRPQVNIAVEDLPEVAGAPDIEAEQELDDDLGVVQESLAGLVINTDLPDLGNMACMVAPKILPEDIDPVVFATISTRYNSVLDSGCTNHIICDKCFFWSLSTTDVVPMKTANCGTLETLARGDVKFRIVVGSKSFIWTLRDCLYAPSAAVNLILVGALQDAGFGGHLPSWSCHS